MSGTFVTSLFLMILFRVEDSPTTLFHADAFLRFGEASIARFTPLRGSTSELNSLKLASVEEPPAAPIGKISDLAGCPLPMQ